MVARSPRSAPPAVPEPVLSGRRRGPTKGDLKEQAILDHALELMITKPFDRITIDDLARGAGISRSSFYFYFDSKQAVLLALFGGIHERFAKGIEGVFGDDGLSMDTAFAALRGYFDDWRDNGRLLRALTVLGESNPQAQALWHELVESTVGVLAQWVERERASGRAPAGPPTSRALVLLLQQMLFRAGWDISVRGAADEEIEVVTADAATVILRAL